MGDYGDSCMKIITVNFPEELLEDIDMKIMNKESPSRSEYVRWCVRRQLMLDVKYQEERKNLREKIYEKKGLVRVPIDEDIVDGILVRKYQTYKLVRRLE
ncbi:hypothetical protein LCGC14_2564860 [marine sediment metagenome]|uniref:Ribbon-helix-helix protein CopG domain-containing protein n=1 Tax=marine sediment metagenome TaxID=412755 RepID=A0A0F9CV56_9ZZZZ